MSNDSPRPDEFGTRQFQKLQFGHRPDEEIKSDEIRSDIKARIARPAKALRGLALLSIIGMMALMAIHLVDLYSDRDALLSKWDGAARSRIMASDQRSGAVNTSLNEQKEAALARQESWNRTYFTLWIGGVVVAYVAGMCVFAFVAVTAHKAIHLEGYRQAVAGSVVSVIPVFSPLVVLGIPFGIWLLIMLKDKNVKRAFAN